MLSGLIGNGISSSLSPQIHEAEAKNCEFALEYRLHDIPADSSLTMLEQTLQDIERAGTVGVNVTHPFKRMVTELIDEQSDDARAIGTINTIAFRNGRRIGHNTDWPGFLNSFRRDLPDADMASVFQVGAGGAGAATAYGLLRGGVSRLHLFDINADLAEQVAARLRSLFPLGTIEVARDVEAALRGSVGIVQATPIGMTGHDGLPIPPEFLRPEHWLIDIIYRPRETALLRCARERGCRTANGLGMVVAQAAIAFEIITGRVPDVDRMRSHLRTIA